MDGLSSLLTWFVDNEAALSGVAATVVIVGFVASPLGAGLRGLVSRWALSSPGVAEAPAAVASSIPDIPSPPEPEADRPSIAVLPFTPASKDEDSEIFADAMSDDIITALGHVPGFFVTSSNTTFVYKGQSIDTRQIGRELGVRYIVEGRIQQAGDDIRINATLVEASSGDQIWSEHFSGDMSDIFALQDQVAQSLVGQIQPELMQAEFRRSSRMPTENLDAWSMLHSARMRFLLGHGREAVEEAVRLAEAALEKDPNYANAHGFLTWAILNLVITRWSDDPARDQERCRFHCHRALELDPENADVLYGAAYLNVTTGDPETAMEQIDRCCDINPNDAFTQAGHGTFLALAGRAEEGLEFLDLAVRLSPRDPRAYYFLTCKGMAQLSLAQYAETEQTLRRALDLYDGFVFSWMVYPMALAMQGKTTEAKEALSRLNQLSPDMRFENWETSIKTVWGNPAGERGALVDSWVNSLRDIWPQ